MAIMESSAQSLEKMQWFNEPESWTIDNGKLVMDVTPQSDYWRVSHYGYVRGVQDKTSSRPASSAMAEKQSRINSWNNTIKTIEQ